MAYILDHIHNRIRRFTMKFISYIIDSRKSFHDTTLPGHTDTLNDNEWDEVKSKAARIHNVDKSDVGLVDVRVI